MRLTQHDRQAFVLAAMEDVPTVDYNTQAQNLVLDHLKATVPVDLQNAIAKYPAWFEPKTVGMPKGLRTFSSRLYAGYAYGEARTDFGEVSKKLKLLGEAAWAQEEARHALHVKLTGAIGGCTTLKQAMELFPEFAKYLPEERGGAKINRSMPAIANLVTDMMNAGWPKDGKPAPKG